MTLLVFSGGVRLPPRPAPAICAESATLLNSPEVRRYKHAGSEGHAAEPAVHSELGFIGCSNHGNSSGIAENLETTSDGGRVLISEAA